MTTTTWSSFFHRSATTRFWGLAFLQRARSALSTGEVARWSHHRLGAFDFARSSLARELLANARR